MNLTPELLIAFNILFTGTVVVLLQVYNSRNAARDKRVEADRIAIKEAADAKRVARQDEVDLLRGEVERLQLRLERQDKRLDQQNTEIDGLRGENTTLHKQMMQLMEENGRLRDSNAELQKQIDELKRKLPGGSPSITITTQ